MVEGQAASQNSLFTLWSTGASGLIGWSRIRHQCQHLGLLAPCYFNCLAEAGFSISKVRKSPFLKQLTLEPKELGFPLALGGNFDKS